MIGATVTAAPSAPTGLSATDGSVCGSVRLSWNPADGAASYQVLRNVMDDPTTAVQVGTIAATSFTDSDINTIAAFFYWVTATNGCGVSGLSIPDSGAAGLPDCSGSAGAPFFGTTDCADGLCASGTGTAMPFMLVGCWFIRKKSRSRRRP